MPIRLLLLFFSNLSPSLPTRSALVSKAATLLVAGSLLVVSCSLRQQGAATPDSGQSTVVVTMDIWADIVSNVACQGGITGPETNADSGIRIETLIPPGSDPHGFEASLRDRTDLGQASLIISNGLGLEESLAQTVESAEADGVPVLRIGEHLDLADHDEPSSSDQASESDHHQHDGAGPHIWLDPLVVSAAVPEIAEHLISHAGLDPEAVQLCAEEYRQELIDLDQNIGQTLAKIPSERRNLVTNHDSLGHFAERYGLTVIGTVIPSSSSLAEASPATIEKLAELITTTNTPAIFSEAEQSNQEATALGERLGVAVVPLHTSSLGPSIPENSTYIDWLQGLANQIADALAP